MVADGNGGKFGHWLSSGLLGTVAWFFVLIIYCTFRAFGIEDPLLGQAFLLLTGAWVGNLTLAQGKKQARVEEAAAAAQAAVAQVAKQVDSGVKRIEVLTEEMVVEQARNTVLEDRADVSETRADDSETRETEWSQHQDHAEDQHDADES